MTCTRALVALSLIAVLWPSLAVAQAPRAGVVTTLEGNVTAARAATPQPVALKFKDDVFVNDRVVTGDRSLARLLLGGKAVVTVRERSALTITEVPGRSTIDLDSGKIAVAVAKDKMRPGEQIEVRTPNAVAAVRGTVFVVEVIRASADASQAQAGVTTNVFAFTGELALTIGSQILTLLANNFATATGAAVNTGPMTQQMRADAVVGLAASGTPPVDGADKAAKAAVLDATIATLNAGLLPLIAAGPILPIEPPKHQLPLPFPGDNRGSFMPRPQQAALPLRAPAGAITPDSIANPPALSPPFGRLVDGGLVTDQYRGLGLVFGPARVAIFDDPPLAWAGVNGSGRLTLVAPVEASFVMPGPSTLAKTNRLSVEVGLAPEGSILLEAFGTAGVLLGWTTNDDGIGPHGRTLATLELEGIHSFRVSGNDSWGMNQVEHGELVDQPSVVTLQGPLLRATQEFRQAFSTFLDATGKEIVGRSNEPLVWLSGSVFTTVRQFASFNESDVTAAGALLRLDEGTLVLQALGNEPLVRMRGGSLSVGTGDNGGHLFELVGRSQAMDSPDRPLILGPESPVFEADNHAVVVVHGSAYKVDAALLEATAPLIKLVGGSALTSTTGHLIDLAGRAVVSLPNDAVAMVGLNGSALTVRNGHLVNVAGGSGLNVAGHLVSLANGATLTLLSGLLLNVSGSSSASISGSLVSFSGMGNALNVTNSIVPTAIINGVPIAGAVDSVRIGANALSGLGTNGTIHINGVPLTPTTSLSSLTGSLVAVQNGSVVTIGR